MDEGWCSALYAGLKDLGPTMIALASLIFAIISSGKASSIQERLASLENRAIYKNLILETYSVFMDFTIVSFIKDKDLYVPDKAAQKMGELEVHRFKLYEKYNQLRLLLLKDESDEAKSLLKAMQKALNAFNALLAEIVDFISSGKYEEAINFTKSSLGQNLNLEDGNNLTEKLKLYLNAMDSQLPHSVREKCDEYIKALGDENFDVYFAKYWNKMM